ncbi:MAG: MarR family transcriptional regulator [Bacteroidia bacterium]|nr:MarR family transcriptional regulator [Bacteroidia bacterium]
MEVKTKDKRRSVDLDIKVAWLAIARMYNKKASLAEITTNIGFVLLHIDENQGTPATKIAPLMGMEARSLTRMLAKLEERGLIYRVPDEKDRRMVRIFLTKEGLDYKALVKDVVIDFNKKIYNAFPEKDLDTFFRVIDGIHKLIDKEAQLLPIKRKA